MRRDLPLGLTVGALLAAMLACSDDDGGPTPPPPSGLPDLRVTGIAVAPPEPEPGDSVTATATVYNAGSAPAGASVLRVAVDGEEVCGSIPVPALPAGETARASCRLGPRSAGLHTVRACADASGVVDEGGEEDNCAIQQFEVVEPPIPGPDLIIETIGGTLEVDETEFILLSVTVRNLGSEDAAASAAQISLDGVVACDEIATPSIPAGGVASVTCERGPRPVGVYLIRACVDVGGAVAEWNEQNNCLLDTLRVRPWTPGLWKPPAIPRAPIRAEVLFNSADSAAVEAESLVEGRLRAAIAHDSVTSAPLARLASLQWSDRWCHAALESVDGCTSLYRFCPGGLNRWEASCTRSGACGGQTLQDFVSWSGLVDRVTTTPSAEPYHGSITFFDLSGVETITVGWNVESTEESGTWRWSRVRPDPEREVARLAYSHDPDGTEQWDWEWSGEERWVLRANSGGTAGTMAIQGRDGSGWHDRHQVLWSRDGHGRWTSWLTDPPQVRTW